MKCAITARRKTALCAELASLKRYISSRVLLWAPQPRHAMTVFRTYKQTIASTKAPIGDEIFHLGNSFSRRTKVYTKRDSQQLRTHNTPNVNERYKWVIYILEYYNICIFNKFSIFMIVCESRRACMTFYFKL